MDQAKFEEAKRAFEAKDYRAAAEGFLAAADGPGAPGNGEAFHLAGNALLKLRKYHHAETVYTHALRDNTYPKVTSVLVNLGTARAAVGEYADAVKAFDAALADPTYARRYRIHQARGGALYGMGRYVDAARDYIAAAEPGNPDRGRAFNNLGLALAAAGKYAEAVDAYRAALSTENYSAKGKASANLGIAYVALGKPAEAVEAFEAATQQYGQRLSENAMQAYEAASAAVRPKPKREIVEGWRTGEMPAVAPQQSVAAPEPSVGVVAEAAAANGDDDSAFFTRTDKEMKELDREMRRAERAERRAGTSPLARAVGAAVAVVAVVALFAAVFFAGYGYPSQRQTVDGMLSAYKQGKPVTDYWIAAAPSGDVGKEMATIPPNFNGATIDRVDRSAFTSKVTVTVKLEKGAPLRYSISLSREGVGWKVVGIDNDWGGPGGS